MNEMRHSWPERENIQRKTIVEIGPNGLPVYTISRTAKEEIENGAMYVGIDYNQDDLETVKRELGNVIVGDFGHLPLKDNSANEVWLLNVFGGIKVIPERQPDGSTTYNLNARRYFEELNRITKPGGEVVIGEFHYPSGGPGSVDWLAESDYDDLDFDKDVFEGEKLKDFMEQRGLRQLLVGKESDEEYRRFFVLLRKRELK